MENLWRSCAKVRELIERPFAVVSGVGPGFNVLDGVAHPEGRGLSGFSPHWFERGF